MPRRITYKMLVKNNACPLGRRFFRQLFPSKIAVLTDKNIARIAQHGARSVNFSFGWVNWLGAVLLDGKYLARFESAYDYAYYPHPGPFEARLKYALKAFAREHEAQGRGK